MNSRRRRTIGIIIASLAAALPIALFIGSQGDVVLPIPPMQHDAGKQRMLTAPQNEGVDKSVILRRDVALTESLCRLQCRMDLRSLARQFSGKAEEESLRSALRQMREEHPHIRALAWIPDGRKAEAEHVMEGNVEESVRGARQAWEQAIRAVTQGKRYESKTLRDHQGKPYFVLGEAATEKGGFVALVHQDVLVNVSRQQLRNLRLQEYPDDDQRFGIRAADPLTGRDVDVKTPEGNQGISHYRKQEAVVRFRTPPSQAELERIKREIDADWVQKLGNSFVFHSKRLTTDELLEYFAGQDIVFAEPHYVYVTNETIEPNDELYRAYQWNLPIIDTPQGWELSTGRADVIVAVVDTGVALNHPDLRGHLVDGYNVVTPTSPPADDVGHGTHVAGIISALTDNRQGIAGMTWHNKIMPVKVLDSTGMGSTYAVAEGIIWAADRGAKVINLSLGNYASAQFLHDAIRYAYDKDVAIIAATGNDNTSQPGFPAAYPEVLAVSATNAYGEKASFSNYGDYVDVTAPGENIASTYTGNQYAALSGTSMASPHVAALAALIRSANPELKNYEVYEIIRNSAVDLGPAGRDPYFGYGQINVARALQLATGQSLPEAQAGHAEPVQRLSFWEALLRMFYRS
jgi:thermitase